MLSGFNPCGSSSCGFASSWLTLPQPAGRLASADGPRSDVSDMTRYVYYPIDNSVTAVLRGRLAAVQNAASHVVRYESYDVFGNADRIVDANGVATTATFDALGRPLTTVSKGVAGCDTAADPLCAIDPFATRYYVYSPENKPACQQAVATVILANLNKERAKRPALTICQLLELRKRQFQGRSTKSYELCINCQRPAFPRDLERTLQNFQQQGPPAGPYVPYFGNNDAKIRKYFEKELKGLTRVDYPPCTEFVFYDE